MDELKSLQSILSELTPQLPIQNPMPFFVHNNPLQYWEQYSFEEGIIKACTLYENTGIEFSRSFLREFEDILIPVVSSYLDQGLQYWKLNAFSSLWQWYLEYLNSSTPLKSKNFFKLKRNLNSYRNLTSEDVVCKILAQKFNNTRDWKFHIKSLLFHFKGWSGMIHLLEKNPDRFPLKKVNISLMDWLAVLIYTESQLNTEKLNWNQSAFDTRCEELLSQLNRIKKNEMDYKLSFISKFQTHLKNNLLTSAPSNLSTKSPVVQVFFCIDDREEALRRYLEKINPSIETFGTVGFFGVDIAIKNYGQEIFQNYCPPVVQPRKKYLETIPDHYTVVTKKFQYLATFFNHSRFTWHEPFLTMISPLVYVFTLALRSFFPKKYNQFKSRFLGPSKSKLPYNYINTEHEEYTLVEKAEIVLNILKSAGLKSNFSKIVVMLAHGSTTNNNPFQKSYGCGACSGQSGFPNSKLFCSFANDKTIRNELFKLNYIIPEDVVFVPAVHDTCSDTIIFDNEKVSHLSQENQNTIKQLKIDFEKALSKNTHLRFSQFKIPLNVNPLNRAHDWSQPRPEYGHSNVSLAIFGPRVLTENIDLERKSFLISYDPFTDSDGSELANVILGALPVCANISLDYFTSTAFPEAFGSGSKLPMNIVSGIGLMTGSKSDLKIGLAKQMVDQHNPLRILVFIYCFKKHLDEVIIKNPRLQRIIQNQWIEIIRIDPVTLEFSFYQYADTKEKNNEHGI